MEWHGEPPDTARYELMARDIVEAAKTAPRQPRPVTVGSKTMNRIEKKIKHIEQESKMQEVEGFGVF